MSTDNGPGKARAEGAGGLVDVATPSVAKLIPLSLFWLAFGGPLLVGGVWMAAEDVAGRLERGLPMDWGWLGLSAGCFLAGWVISSAAARNVRAMFQRDIYFRAGPRGVSAHVPGRFRFSRLMLGYEMVKMEFTWDRVDSWYIRLNQSSLIQSNLISFAAAIVFDLDNGAQAEIPTRYFLQGRKTIVENVNRARAGAAG